MALPITPEPPIFNLPLEIVVEPEKVLVPVKVCIPLPLIIKFPLPDKTPSNELFIEESISNVAPDSILKLPFESLFLPQFPERITLPA